MSSKSQPKTCAHPKCQGDVWIPKGGGYNVHLCAEHYKTCYILYNGRCFYWWCRQPICSPTYGKNPGLCCVHYDLDYRCNYPFFPKCEREKEANGFCDDHACYAKCCK